jgi:hypothetical protein
MSKRSSSNLADVEFPDRAKRKRESSLTRKEWERLRSCCGGREALLERIAKQEWTRSIFNIEADFSWVQNQKYKDLNKLSLNERIRESVDDFVVRVWVTLVKVENFGLCGAYFRGYDSALSLSAADAEECRRSRTVPDHAAIELFDMRRKVSYSLTFASDPETGGQLVTYDHWFHTKLEDMVNKRHEGRAITTVHLRAFGPLRATHVQRLHELLRHADQWWVGNPDRGNPEIHVSFRNSGPRFRQLIFNRRQDGSVPSRLNCAAFVDWLFSDIISCSRLLGPLSYPMPAQCLPLSTYSGLLASCGQEGMECLSSGIDATESSSTSSSSGSVANKQPGIVAEGNGGASALSVALREAHLRHSPPQEQHQQQKKRSIDLL